MQLALGSVETLISTICVTPQYFGSHNADLGPGRSWRLRSPQCKIDARRNLVFKQAPLTPATPAIFLTFSPHSRKEGSTLPTLPGSIEAHPSLFERPRHALFVSKEQTHLLQQSELAAYTQTTSANPLRGVATGVDGYKVIFVLKLQPIASKIYERHRIGT